jgi:hypothetical protein
LTWAIPDLQLQPCSQLQAGPGLGLTAAPAAALPRGRTGSSSEHFGMHRSAQMAMLFIASLARNPCHYHSLSDIWVERTGTACTFSLAFVVFVHLHVCWSLAFLRPHASAQVHTSYACQHWHFCYRMHLRSDTHLMHANTSCSVVLIVCMGQEEVMFGYMGRQQGRVGQGPPVKNSRACGGDGFLLACKVM